MSRILIVDDKEDNTYYLRVLLEGHGHVVETACHGGEALVKARRHPPDLAVSDLLMPVMDGYTLLWLWKADAKLRDIPFIVYTATYTDPEDERLALSLGADAFILKPSEPEDILARIREMIDHATARKPGPARLPAGEEKELLKGYSETLIRKLEEKTLQLEEANNALREDIAGRRKAENALRLLNSAVLQSRESIMITEAELDPPGPKIVFVNPAFTRMTGYSSGEVLGRTPRILQGPRTDRKVLDRVRETLARGEVFEGEAINYRKDGVEYVQEWQVTPLRSEDGEVTHFVAIQRDITERKRWENELGWKTAFLQAQVDSDVDGVLVVTPEGRKILQNQRLDELLKIPPEITSGDNDDQQIRFVARRTRNPRQFIEKVAYLNSHPAEVSRDEIELTDGSVLDRYSAPVKDSSGVYYGRIWTFRDVTAERKRETELAQALEHEKELSEKARAGERAKSEFLAVMSHEIRTPLNGILGFSELLAQNSGLPNDARGHARTIVASGEALLHILDDVLDFSRIEAGRMQIEHTAFSPGDLLENTRLLLAPLAAEKSLSLEVSTDSAAPLFVAGDAARTRQILLNLTGNAVKFTERGRVTLGFRPGEREGWLEFFVLDTGTGIPAGQAENIFLPFTQADSSHTRRHGGAGLGLAISRRLAELMGGTLSVRSEPGNGAEFLLSLPLAETSAPVRNFPETPPLMLDAAFARIHPLRVLVVEDDKVNRRLILTLLRRLGYEPLSATNGRDAVEIHRETNPDCILMDLQMPGMDGIDATRGIRATEAAGSHGRPAFIAALTANIIPADRERCFEAGMNGYLTKPVKLASVADILIEATRR